MDRGFALGAAAQRWSGSKGGSLEITVPNQQILDRTSCIITAASSEQANKQGTVEIRFRVALPAQGRTILGEVAHNILARRLPELIRQTMLWSSQDQQALIQHVQSVEDQTHLRRQLAQKSLIAFVANGSILPRASGASSLPMTGDHVIPFKSPPSLEVELDRPNAGPVRGMGIPKGITVISGGGFHGKSTLLEALELGIYDHVPGDGRENVVSDADVMKIRAEDGRSVTGVDISPFISGLPGNRDTSKFTTAVSLVLGFEYFMLMCLPPGCQRVYFHGS